MMTVDSSANVNRCSAQTPLEFATPTVNEEVVIDPAAEHPRSAAFRQIIPTLAARCSGVHSATAPSNASTGVILCGDAKPLNSGFSGCSLATSQARTVNSWRLAGLTSFETAM